MMVVGNTTIPEHDINFTPPKINPEDLTELVSQEHDRRSLKSNGQKEKGEKDAAFAAGSSFGLKSKGHPIGAQGGTASDDYLEAFYKGSDIRLYKSTDEAYQDLGAGRLDAVFAGEPTSYAFMQTPAGKGCKFVGERAVNPKIFGTGVGITLRKTDPDLRDKLNAALKQILADGTYEAISKKYFPFSIY